ncbi:MAG: zinc ribbon domain-containing protein, partial [Actinobacteria bacterium]|nr:zinc ribbon domain-containing protein [Actinomycetota bacterium]
KRKVGGRPRTYPLVGLLRCGKCGGPLRSLARENGGRSYACRSGPGLDGCGGIRIQAKGVEEYVRDLVCGTLADPETRAALTKIAGDQDGDDSSIIEKLRAVEAKRQRLVDLYTDGDIARAEFRTRRDALDEQVCALEAEMARGRGSRVLAGVPATFDELVEAWDVRGVEFQRRLSEALLHPILVKPAGSRRRLFDADRLVIDPRA